MHDYVIPLIPFIAFMLDMACADPHWLPHPVRGIGAYIDFCHRNRAFFPGKGDSKIFGTLALGAGIVIFPFIVQLLITIPLAGIILAIYFAYAGLSLKGLATEGWKVEEHLRNNDLEGARYALSMLVSRETAKMDKNDIRRSLAETISENFSDGFMAPLAYLVSFGPVGMWVYKTINTFDSMWGYKTPEYVNMGWAAAKVDDAANWVPARISLYVLIATGKFMGLNTKFAMKYAVTDAHKMESPNAGWPMAACAWLLEGTMGGPTVYAGKVKEKPLLGPPRKTWTEEKIEKLFLLIARAGWLSIAAATVLAFTLS